MKLKRGYSVELTGYNNDNFDGKEGIVVKSSKLFGRSGPVVYDILLFFNPEIPIISVGYPINNLILLCSNEKKGEEILKKFGA